MAELVEKLWKKGGPLVSLNEAERSAVFILSTADLDRDGETVDPAGIDLAEFKRNPVVALNHDTNSLPIAASWKSPGAPVEVWLDEVEIDGQRKQALLGKAYFSQANPQGQLAFSMVKEGTLNGASVSFLPEGRPEKNAAGGNHWGASRLLEWSICPLGSNPHALALAWSRLKGLNGETSMAKQQADVAKEDEKEKPKEDEKEKPKDEEPVAKGELDQANPPQEEPVLIDPENKAIDWDCYNGALRFVTGDDAATSDDATEAERAQAAAICAKSGGVGLARARRIVERLLQGPEEKAWGRDGLTGPQKNVLRAIAQGKSAPPPEPPPPRFQDTVAEVVAILADQQARLSKSEGAVSKHCQAVLKGLLVGPVEQPLTAIEEEQLEQAVEQLKQAEARLGENLYRFSGRRLW